MPADSAPVQMVELYGLLDPVTNELRYIGKANDARSRLRGHLREARRKTPLYAWIGKLRAEGLTPRMEILERCASDVWQEAEKRLIAIGRAKGMPLLNLADGGDEPLCRAEVRVGNALALNERLRDDPLLARIQRHKRALSIALRHGQLSNFARRCMREAAALAPNRFGEWANVPDVVDQ